MPLDCLTSYKKTGSRQKILGCKYNYVIMSQITLEKNAYSERHGNQQNVNPFIPRVSKTPTTGHCFTEFCTCTQKINNIILNYIIP